MLVRKIITYINFSHGILDCFTHNLLVLVRLHTCN